MCVSVCVCVCVILRPSDGVLGLFLNESNALQNISDVIYTTFLLHIQHVCCLRGGSKIEGELD